MTKFKVGDRVRVTEECTYSYDDLAVGTELEITEVTRDEYFPFRAKCFNDEFDNYSYGRTTEGILFAEDELERIPELDPTTITNTE